MRKAAKVLAEAPASAPRHLLDLRAKLARRGVNYPDTMYSDLLRCAALALFDRIEQDLAADLPWPAVLVADKWSGPLLGAMLAEADLKNYDVRGLLVINGRMVGTVTPGERAALVGFTELGGDDLAALARLCGDNGLKVGAAYTAVGPGGVLRGGVPWRALVDHHDLRERR